MALHRAAHVTPTQWRSFMRSATVQPLLLSLPDAASALGISPRLLATLSKDGTVRSVRVRSRRLFAADDLRAFVEGQRRTAAQVEERDVP